jgi:uncharacterized protein with HEPN domain
MLAAIERVRRYIGRKARATFLRNALLQDAVIRNIEIVGEAAGRVSIDTTTRTPEIPWREIVGMRHRLIHGYLEVNLEIVWQVAQRDLPGLERKLRVLIEPVPRAAAKRTGRTRIGRKGVRATRRQRSGRARPGV